MGNKIKYIRIGMAICCIGILIALLLNLLCVIPESRLFKILTYGFLGLIMMLTPIIIPRTTK